MRRILGLSLLAVALLAQPAAQTVVRRPITSAAGTGCAPVNAVLDNANRADTGPPPSTNWTTGVDGGTDGFTVSSNQFAPTASTLSTNWWNVSNFGPKVEVYDTIINFSGGSARLSFRIQQEGTAGYDGYTVLAYKPTNEFYVYRVDNGTQTQLGAAISQTLSDGDSFRASMDGSTITVCYCPSGGSCGVGGASWTSMGTRTDSTYTGAGKISMGAFDTTSIRLDNFGGGTLP